MARRLGWIVILAAAAAAGCLTGQGAVRGAVVPGADAGPAQVGPPSTAPVVGPVSP